MGKVGIVGSGNMGRVLAKRLVALGYLVKAANSRGRLSLQEFALQTGAEAADIEDVAKDVEVLILTVPLAQVEALPKAMLASLPKTGIVVDVSNYVPVRDGDIEEIEAGLPETVWVSRRLGVSVVKAFNNIADSSLEHGGRAKTDPNRIALPIAGDDPAGRAVIMQLVEDLGFEPFDAGALTDSWRQQLGQPAYCTDPTSTQLRCLLARAQHETLGPKRRQAMVLMTKLPADFAKRDLLRVARLMVGLDLGRPSSWLSLFRLVLAMRPSSRHAAPAFQGEGLRQR